MPIAQLGTINLSALNVPQALVQIVPPQYLFGGVATNIGGLVGTAAWGPTGLPMGFGGYSQFAQIFGPTINRKYDMGAHVILAQSQGASAFMGVRITDGTDVAATAAVSLAIAATGAVTFTGQPTASQTLTLGSTGITFVASGATGNQVNIGANIAATLAALMTFLQASSDTNLVKFSYVLSGLVLNLTAVTAGTAGNSLTLATTVTGATVSGSTLSGGAAAATQITYTGKYTGTLGNSIKVTHGTGTQVGTKKIIVSCPGLATEIFDNVGLGLSGNALWVAMAAAVNSGSSASRPPSNIVVATAGAGTATVPAAAYPLLGGTDGAAGIVSSGATTAMLGVDALPRTGMYALRGTGIARFDLCDLDDVTSFSTQIPFGLDIGAEAIMVTPASDTLTTAATELANAGIDNYAGSVIFGDWVFWIDTINNVAQRMTSPQALKLGMRGNLSPQNSALNKQLQGIIGTQSTLLGRTYSYADFQALSSARLDLVSNQSPGGAYFAFRFGINTSSNAVIQDDAYTDVTNFLAKSILKIAGQYIGMTQSADERRRARVSLNEFLALAQTNSIIGTPDGSQAYQVVLDNSNNNQASVALGYQYAYVKAIYLGIIRYFIVNLEGGASVTISNTPPGQ